MYKEPLFEDSFRHAILFSLFKESDGSLAGSRLMKHTKEKRIRFFSIIENDSQIYSIKAHQGLPPFDPLDNLKTFDDTICDGQEYGAPDLQKSIEQNYKQAEYL